VAGRLGSNIANAKCNIAYGICDMVTYIPGAAHLYDVTTNSPPIPYPRQFK